MCGIAGIFSRAPGSVRLDTLRRMTDAIRHRGPEGDGFWINESGTAGFGHRRLSIMDISAHAAQPMHLSNRYTIVFNGAIYNYPELREQLIRKGYQFHTESDTEVMLAAYDHYRENCLSHFEGMFAFAIHDASDRRVFCARDRFGEKPLYYNYRQETGDFVFGSEIKAIRAAGISTSINDALLLQYLACGHTSHLTDKQSTFYTNIKQLPAAHYLTYELTTGIFEICKYWSLPNDKSTISEGIDVDARFHSLFTASVSRRLRAQVPYGTSLSGGLDSSSIVAAISSSNTGRSLASFSAVFPGFDRDESTYIQTVAKQFSLDAGYTTPSATDFENEITGVIQMHEEPVSSASVFAQYKVFELAKQQNVPVLLDGQGADELLAGYSKYHNWFIQELVRRGNFGKAFSESKLLHKNAGNDISIPVNFLASINPILVASLLEKRERKKLISNEDITREFAMTFAPQAKISKPIIRNLNDTLASDMLGYGLEDLLRYADRNAMAHGRETRLPFLDHSLVEFCFSLPSRFKISRGWTKFILRKWADNKLPNDIVWRKNKIAFEPPQNSWLNQPGSITLINNAIEALIAQKILKPASLIKKNQPLSEAADKRYWRYLVAGTLIQMR
jgi:asparagine synthase (glutamine-hydrolysing)